MGEHILPVSRVLLERLHLLDCGITNDVVAIQEELLQRRIIREGRILLLGQVEQATDGHEREFDEVVVDQGLSQV